MLSIFFFQAEDGIRDIGVTGVQTCALPISVDGENDSTDVTAAGKCRGRRRLHADGPGFEILTRLHRRELHLHCHRDRKSVVKGKSVDLGGRRIIKKKKTLASLASS